MEGLKERKVYQTPLMEAFVLCSGPIMQVTSGGNEGTGDETWSVSFSNDLLF